MKMPLNAVRRKKRRKLSHTARHTREEIAIQQYPRRTQEIRIEIVVFLLIVVPFDAPRNLPQRTPQHIRLPYRKCRRIQILNRLVQLVEQIRTQFLVCCQSVIRVTDTERVDAVHPLDKQSGDLLQSLLERRAEIADELRALFFQ